MQKFTRKDPRVWACLLATALVADGASVGAGRTGPGTVSEGNFIPRRASAANYGPDSELSCPTHGAVGMVSTELETRAKQARRPVPQADGRLCAMAETLLGWTGDAPGEHVIGFLSAYFGLTAPVSSVLITTTQTVDQSLIGARSVDPVAKFSQTAVQPHFGMAVQPLTGAGRAENSKIVLLMQDALVDVQPIPRKLSANSQATLRGQLVGSYQNPKVFIADPTGHLESPSVPPGKEFQTQIRCADKAGTIQAEVRGELNGVESILANFTIACGTEPPTSVALSKSAAAVGDVAQQEQKLFQLINDERTKAGLPALQSDAAVAGIARSLSEQRRDQLKGGGAAANVNILERLKEAGIQSPVVLTNPAAARSPQEAQERFSGSPVHRANYMSTEKNVDVDLDNLYVKHAVANDGPRMKRIRPAPMGRAYRYQRRMAHIEVALAERRRAGAESVATVVGEEEKAPSKVAKGKTAGKPRKKAAARKTAGKKKTAKAKG